MCWGQYVVLTAVSNAASFTSNFWLFIGVLELKFAMIVLVRPPKLAQICIPNNTIVLEGQLVVLIRMGQACQSWNVSCSGAYPDLHMC